MSDKISPQQYVKSSKHLPHFLRDFHNQKDIFKWIEGLAISHLREDTKSSQHYINEKLPDWVTAQIYTIDFFLWFMGQFGYTLQKSRANVEFRSLEEIDKYHEDLRIQYTKMLIDGMNKET